MLNFNGKGLYQMDLNFIELSLEETVSLPQVSSDVYTRTLTVVNLAAN